MANNARPSSRRPVRHANKNPPTSPAAATADGIDAEASLINKWEGLLTAELTEAGAAHDDGILAAARALIELTDQPGAKSGKYNVTITDSQEVQVGDSNFQINKF